MSKQIMSKSGVVGKNKRGKPTTAAKKRKKREQKRSDRAWVFSTDDSHKSESPGKHEDAWMYEHVGRRDATTASKPH